MTDLLGRDFCIGQLIAYGGRAGSHGYMSVGRIKKIGPATLSVEIVKTSGWANEGSNAVVQRPARAVIIND